MKSVISVGIFHVSKKVDVGKLKANLIMLEEIYLSDLTLFQWAWISSKRMKPILFWSTRERAYSLSVLDIQQIYDLERLQPSHVFSVPNFKARNH